MALRRIFALLTLALAVPAQALDYRSLAEAAPAYDAPSAKSKPLFVVLAGTPVEQVVALDGWSKVRDNRGDLVWIEKKYLRKNAMSSSAPSAPRCAPPPKTRRRWCSKPSATSCWN